MVAGGLLLFYLNSHIVIEDLRKCVRKNIGYSICINQCLYSFLLVNCPAGLMLQRLILTPEKEAWEISLLCLLRPSSEKLIFSPGVSPLQIVYYDVDSQ